MGRGPEQIFFQRRNTYGQRAHEKMLNAGNHERNKNQNHNEITSHTYKNWLLSKKQQMTSLGQGREVKGTSLFSWWERKWKQPLGK